MRKLIVENSKCINCGNCLLTCSKAFFKEECPEKSAIRVQHDNDSIQISVCSQCGECISICPVRAIYRDKNGVVRIDKNKCIGCLSCVGFCDIRAMHYYRNNLIPFKCIACGLCVKDCPTGAISLEQ